MDLFVANAVQKCGHFPTLGLRDQVMGLQMLTRNDPVAHGANVGGLVCCKWDGQEGFSFDFSQWNGPLLVSNH